MGLLMRFQRLAAEGFGISKPPPEPEHGPPGADERYARAVAKAIYLEKLSQWECCLTCVMEAFDKAGPFDRPEFLKRVHKKFQEMEACRAGEIPDR